jgi:pimeloyl-ACP methyl ester carboxylesterase
MPTNCRRGGDYGFPFTPHGTYARDLEVFVKILDFTPMEAILSATAGIAKLFMREEELGKIQPGYFADCILVDGNPLEDITVLQNHDKLNVIMINGRIHKAASEEFGKSASSELIPSSINTSSRTMLTRIGDNLLHVQKLGVGSEHMIFVHGLGSNAEFFQPLIASLGLAKSHKLYLFDLRGHGQSPARASSHPTIDSYAADLAGVFQKFHVTSGILVAHSMGCLVAIAFALKNPSLVKKLVLIGPLPTALPAPTVNNVLERARVVRASGMRAIAETVVVAGTSAKTKTERPVALSAIRASLMSATPEGYAQACTALAACVGGMDITQLGMLTLIISGNEDLVSPPSLAQSMKSSIKGATVEVLKDCGHWHTYEDPYGVAMALKTIL